MDDCLFCKIIEGEVPSTKVYEDDNVLGFNDIHPCAPIHKLFIHKNHHANVNEMARDNADTIAQVYTAIEKWTSDQGLEEKGFRVSTNIGPDSGQIVFHTHFHVLAGERLKSL